MWHGIGPKSSQVPALSQLSCSCAQQQRDPPDAPSADPSGSAGKGTGGVPNAGSVVLRGRRGRQAGCPTPAAVGRKPTPLLALTTATSLKSERAEPSLAKLAAPCASRGAATPNQAVPSIDCCGSRLPQERGQRSPASPVLLLSHLFPVLLLSHVLPAIHHRLPLSLRRRGCHPAVAEAEKNEPFKRGTVGEHETN